MQLLKKGQEKYYCNMCSRILSNGTEITCSCDQTRWCITCANYQNKCLNCEILICNDCGFSPELMICKECNVDKWLMVKKYETSVIIQEERCSDCDKYTNIKKLTRCEFCQKEICIQCVKLSHPCVNKITVNKINTKIILKPEHLKDTIMSFAGKIVVITGKLKSMKRQHAELLVITSGGDARSTVSRNTDFVVVGENPGSKLDRAQELDIRIITEAEFLNWAKPQLSVIQTTTVKKKESKKKRRILL